MIGAAVDTLSRAFGDAQQWLFETVAQPLMFQAGLGNLLADGYRATGWLLVGVLQIGVMLTLFAALERWRPVERVTDRAAVRVDILYTLLHRLGLFRVLLFFTLAMAWIGVLVGLLVGTVEVAQQLGFLVVFPLTFLSSAFVATDTLPGPLQPIAEWNPFSALVWFCCEFVSVFELMVDSVSAFVTCLDLST